MIECRLCGGLSEKKFNHKVLAKYDVNYFQCRSCEGIQTEPPYWLSEVYTTDVQPEDENYLSRNLNVAWIVQFLLKHLKTRNDPVVLDFGGGLGLVSRLLRENGVNAFNYDTYTDSPFANVKWDGSVPNFIISSEVFEHLTNPAKDIDWIFGHRPDFVYARTWRYFKQGKDWDYIGAEHGAHVFFYTDKAMRYISDKYGYNLELLSEVEALFSKRPLSKFEKRVALKGLESRSARAVLKLAAKFS